MKTLVLLLVLSIGGCASTTDGKRIEKAQVADIASTAVALGLNKSASEINPLGPAIVPLKLAAGKLVETYVDDCETRQKAVRGANAVTYGAVGNNVAVALGVSPAPLVGALVAAYYFTTFQANNCRN